MMAIQTPDQTNGLQSQFTAATGDPNSWQNQSAGLSAEFRRSSDPVGGATHFLNGELREDNSFIDSGKSFGTALSDVFFVIAGLFTGRNAGGVEISGVEEMNRRMDLVGWSSNSGDEYAGKDPAEIAGANAPAPEQPLKFTPTGSSGPSGMGG